MFTLSHLPVLPSMSDHGRVFLCFSICQKPGKACESPLICDHAAALSWI